MAQGQSEANQMGTLHDLHIYFSNTKIGDSRDGRHEPREAFLLQRTEILLERIYFSTPFDLNRFRRYSAVFLQSLAKLT